MIGKLIADLIDCTVLQKLFVLFRASCNLTLLLPAQTRGSQDT